jgi:hypothetical protein
MFTVFFNSLIQFVNATGSIFGSLVATVLRLLIGEQLIGLPPTFQFPTFEDEEQVTEASFYNRS